MAKTGYLQMRIEPEFKQQVESILSQLGTTPTDAINLFFKQIVLTGGIPFAVQLPTPNADTIEAMREAEQMGLEGKNYRNAKELFDELDAGL